MSRSTYSLLAGLTVFGLALVATPVIAAPMTQSQIDTITKILGAYDASTSTIASVQATLSGPDAAVAVSSSTLREEAIRAFMIGHLRRGDSGDKVRYLQGLLAADPDVYPLGMITGFYGPLTENAVKAFQRKYGLEMVGFIGPKTLERIEEKLGTDPIAVSTSTPSRICAVVPPGHLIAPGWLKHHDDDSDDHKVLPCRDLPYGIAKKLGLSTSTPTTTHDMTAPTISALVVGSVGTTGAMVTWSTNEHATGVVSFGTTTGYGMVVSQGSALTIAHSIMLTGLSASTTYHVQVTSADKKGNAATSSNITFTTGAGVVVDTTAPMISGVSVGGLASTSASVMWATNEAANSKVYFGTTTPLVFASSTSVVNAAFATSHSLALSSLMASTTYYYIVESADASGNIATTTQAMFTTPN